MQITKITVTAARTFNHPTERFANFRFEMTLEANLHPGDGYMTSLDHLREAAENAAEQHKQEILAELAARARRKVIQREIAMAKTTQEDIEEDRLALSAMLELQKIDDTSTRRWEIKHLQDRIEWAEKALASIPALEAELAALPAPKLLPDPELHAGHLDHPDTEDGDDS